MGNRHCEHGIELVSVLGKDECAECVLVRLSAPIREYSRIILETDQETALRGIKASFALNTRDIVLIGWVWDEWEKRNL